MAGYLGKMKGGAKSPPGVSIREVLWAWAGSVTGIALCGYLSSRYFEPADSTLVIGSFGASAVLLYAAVRSPLAQPRNLLGGHFLSAIAGVVCYKLFGNAVWIASALAVSTAIVVMLLTRTLHPPGGATALIAVIGGEKIHNLGFLYALVPTALGAVILLAIALIVNNIPSHRRYPEYWL